MQTPSHHNFLFNTTFSTIIIAFVFMHSELASSIFIMLQNILESIKVAFVFASEITFL